MKNFWVALWFMKNKWKNTVIWKIYEYLFRKTSILSLSKNNTFMTFASYWYLSWHLLESLHPNFKKIIQILKCFPSSKTYHNSYLDIASTNLNQNKTIKKNQSVCSLNTLNFNVKICNFINRLNLFYLRSIIIIYISTPSSFL